MYAIRKLLIFIRWPAIVGIAAAVAYTQLIDSGSPDNSSTTRELLKRDWRGPVSYAKAVDRASASVVNIYTRKIIPEKRHPFFDDPIIQRFYDSSANSRQRMQQTLGSGVIMRQDGYIITNFHVIQDADEIAIVLQDGREARAEVMGVNRERDLAVLQVPLKNLPVIPIANASQLRVGDVVLAIGNPLGLGQTVTQGIISATQRKDLHISIFEGFIQTDAAINPGNSGGALVDAYGNLLGINVANLDKSGYTAGIGFAIPAKIAMQTLEDIVVHGRVVRGWLGVEAQMLTPELATQIKTNLQHGIIVLRTDIGSPAEKAGLKPGDVIVSINHQPTEDVISGWQRIAESRPGETVSIEFVRGNVVMQTNAILGELPAFFKN